MKNIKLYRFSLFLSFSVIMFGTIFKVQHWPGSKLLLFIALLISLVYIIIGLIEIFKTESKSIIEKLLWLIGFITLSWIVGMIYYYKELVPKYKIK